MVSDILELVRAWKLNESHSYMSDILSTGYEDESNADRGVEGIIFQE